MTSAVEPDRSRLQPWQVLGDAIRVLRRHYVVLWTVALAVFAPLSVAEALLEGLHADGVLVNVVEPGAELVIHLLGNVIYAGFVAAAVIAWRTGDPRHGPWQVLRALPWRTLIVLDLMIPFVTAFLTLLLIIPGVAFYTYTVLAAPVVKLEHVGVRAALTRSYRLVRGSFWRVLLVLFAVVVVAGVAQQLLQEATPHFVGDLLVSLAIQTLFAPLFGLATVLMAIHLGARPPVAAHA